MGEQIKKTIPYILGSGIATFILSFPARFLESWMMSILQEQIQQNWQGILSFAVIWLLPLAVSIGLVYFGYRMRARGVRMWEEAERLSPLVKMDRVRRAVGKSETAERELKLLTIQEIAELKKVMAEAKTLGQTSESEKPKPGDELNQSVPDKEDSQTE